MPTAIRIDFHAACAFPRYLHAHVRAAARAALAAIPAPQRARLRPGRRYRLAIAVVSKPAIRRLNREYRGKDKATDVLSFSRIESATPVSAEPDLGDVIVCWEMAKRQTREFHTTRPTEVQRLVVHGILHVFGYDHERGPAEARRMFALQESILRRLAARRKSPRSPR